jgi:hypothetical protein
MQCLSPWSEPLAGETGRGHPIERFCTETVILEQNRQLVGVGWLVGVVVGFAGGVGWMYHLRP